MSLVELTPFVEILKLANIFLLFYTPCGAIPEAYYIALRIRKVEMEEGQYGV